MKDTTTLASLSWMPRGVMKKSVQKILVLGCSPRPCESGPLAWVFLSLSNCFSTGARRRATHPWHPGKKDKHTCQGLFPFPSLTVLGSIGWVMFSSGGTTCYFDILITISHWLISLSKHVNLISPESERVCSFCLWACLWHQRMSLEEHRDPSGIPERSHVGHKQV